MFIWSKMEEKAYEFLLDLTQQKTTLFTKNKRKPKNYQTLENVLQENFHLHI